MTFGSFARLAHDAQHVFGANSKHAATERQLKVGRDGALPLCNGALQQLDHAQVTLHSPSKRAVDCTEASFFHQVSEHGFSYTRLAE